jgi:uncharacterized protein (DUF305 family)
MHRLVITVVVALAALTACTGISSSDPNAPIEQQFIDMMVPHHESAIAMAEIALERAQHAELRELAGEIIAAQSAEIEQLRAWRREWFGSEDTPPMEAMPMLPGMDMGGHAMSGNTMDMTADVKRLERASDDEFDQRFIDAMIAHHEQAVEAANIALERSERQEIRDLSEAIIEAQTREIEQLRDWRAEWY